jgi:hypothetical protein
MIVTLTRGRGACPYQNNKQPHQTGRRLLDWQNCGNIVRPSSGAISITVSASAKVQHAQFGIQHRWIFRRWRGRRPRTQLRLLQKWRQYFHRYLYGPVNLTLNLTMVSVGTFLTLSSRFQACGRTTWPCRTTRTWSTEAGDEADATFTNLRWAALAVPRTRSSRYDFILVLRRHY